MVLGTIINDYSSSTWLAVPLECLTAAGFLPTLFLVHSLQQIRRNTDDRLDIFTCCKWNMRNLCSHQLQ